MRFSERKGMKKVSEIIQVEGMNADLRNSLWNVLDLLAWRADGFIYDRYKESGIELYSKELWFGYFKKPIDARPSSPGEILDEIREYFFECCKLNRSRQSKGSIWQHQFWDRFVRNNQEMRLRLDYMHHNPVRKGLVRRPEDWSWSSHNNLALDHKSVARCPIQIDRMVLPDSYRG